MKQPLSERARWAKTLRPVSVRPKKTDARAVLIDRLLRKK